MSRPIHSAVVLGVGSELTTGSTRDTNSGDLARELTAMGVEVLYLQALPDRLERVRGAFAAALQAADLVISTGGLGPTPDDLTREAIAAATGLETYVDPQLERWLRTLFRRRGVEMPESNLKQAWLVAGAQALRNGNGTAPGWWLEMADGGGSVVALPGPPREMWPMWREQVVPRLIERGAGGEIFSETLRLTGIGESALAELIGEDVLRNPEPEVATYARADGVDVKVTGRGEGAVARVAAALDELLPKLERHVFARGEDGWPQVLERSLGGRSLAILEAGLGGHLIALLGGAAFLAHAELVPLSSDAAAGRDATPPHADVTLRVRAVPEEVDTRVEIEMADGRRSHREERRAFLTGGEGQRRAALAACAALWQWLGDNPRA